MNQGHLPNRDQRLRTPLALATFGLLLLSLAGGLAGCGGGGGGGGGTQPPTTTAAELTTQGWTAFEQNSMSTALVAFTGAIALDSNYGPAYVGQGWCRLDQATNSGQFLQAVSSFDGAFGRQQAGAEVSGGRAAACLALGRDSLAAAIAAARAARLSTPSFVFGHRTSVTAVDLRLIEIFGRAAQGNFSAALAAADSVQASGIQAGSPGTWTVDGTVYPSFESAVLGYLNKLSNQNAG